MYFIPISSKNCTNSHGQRLPQLIRCTWLAEGPFNFTSAGWPLTALLA